MLASQPQVIIVITWVTIILVNLFPVEANKKFEQYDLPKLIDLEEADFAPLKGNSIESEDQESHCPFADRHNDYDNNDDWQIIDLPHGGDPQFNHVDHLPMKMIDYSWPLAMMKKSKHYDGSKKSKSLEARKLFLEKKFNYKTRLMPPVNNPIPLEQYPAYKQGVKLFELRRNPSSNGYSQNLHHQPIVTMFVNHEQTKNIDQNNELIQQQDLLALSEKDASIATENPQLKTTIDLIEFNYGNNSIHDRNDNLKDPPADTSRIRESFKSAAELAKQLENLNEVADSNDHSANSNAISNLTSATSTTFDDDDSSWGSDITNSRGSPSSMDDELLGNPKYLGLGEIYKNNNSRSTTQQVRLSCSFEPSHQDASMSNITISNVKWLKFVGNYDPDQAEPAFECKFRSCRMIEVKNDIWTTVHPRPAVQHYLGGQSVPSYSLTIHQFDPERHYGVYRCSAIRQIGIDKRQLVYRVIPLT